MDALNLFCSWEIKVELFFHLISVAFLIPIFNEHHLILFLIHEAMGAS
jgi:hypothetical protein